MTHARAAEIAATWGVCITGSEPGTVFYSLTGKEGQIETEEHRKRLLDYTADCIKSATLRAGIGESDITQADADDLLALRTYFQNTPTADNKSERFLNGYVRAALFTAVNEDDEPLDSLYSFHDIGDETLNLIRKDCLKFQEEAKDLLKKVYARPLPPRVSCSPEEYAGHNFLLTRNGHGTGFWGQGYPAPLTEKLTSLCRQFGEKNLCWENNNFYYE